MFFYNVLLSFAFILFTLALFYTFHPFSIYLLDSDHKDLGSWKKPIVLDSDEEDLGSLEKPIVLVDDEEDSKEEKEISTSSKKEESLKWRARSESINELQAESSESARKKQDIPSKDVEDSNPLFSSSRSDVRPSMEHEYVETSSGRLTPNYS